MKVDNLKRDVVKIFKIELNADYHVKTYDKFKYQI